MANELQMWALDEGGEVTRVAPLKSAPSEKDFEKTLAKKPDMLMPDLTLVGQQMTASGSSKLDLLGVDGEGRLVVFELKKELLRREAVAQVIDYASFLESMSDSELFELIENQDWSSLDIEQIEKFGDWYDANYPKRDLLRPVRMTVVGLGADDGASRMVEFLARHDLPLSIMTFHGYSHDGRSYFAKQVQTEQDVKERVRAKSARERKEAEEAKGRALEERISDAGIQELWDEVVSIFGKGCGDRTRLKDGLSFFWDSLYIPEHEGGFTVPMSVLLTKEKKIRVIFNPVSIYLCREHFNNSKRNIGFKEEPTRQTKPVNEIDNRWFRDLDEKEWNEHKEELTKLVDAVVAACREAQNGRGRRAGRGVDS